MSKKVENKPAKYLSEKDVSDSQAKYPMSNKLGGGMCPTK